MYHTIVYIIVYYSSFCAGKLTIIMCFVSKRNRRWDWMCVCFRLQLTNTSIKQLTHICSLIELHKLLKIHIPVVSNPITHIMMSLWADSISLYWTHEDDGWSIRCQMEACASVSSPPAPCCTSLSSAAVPHQDPRGQSEHGPECNSLCRVFPVNHRVSMSLISIIRSCWEGWGLFWCSPALQWAPGAEAARWRHRPGGQTETERSKQRSHRWRPLSPYCWWLFHSDVDWWRHNDLERPTHSTSVCLMTYESLYYTRHESVHTWSSWNPGEFGQIFSFSDHDFHAMCQCLILQDNQELTRTNQTIDVPQCSLGTLTLEQDFIDLKMTEI